MLYSMGLDLDAILPRASRARATYAVAVVATACVFAGHYASTAQDAMTSFVLLLTAIGTPWAVITLIGFARCGGVYDADALQVFNRRARGGDLLVPRRLERPGDRSPGRRARRSACPGRVPAVVRGAAAGADRRGGLQLPAVGGWWAGSAYLAADDRYSARQRERAATDTESDDGPDGHGRALT